MEISKLMLAVGATIPILLAACSGANAERAPSSESPSSENTGGVTGANTARPEAVATPPVSSSTPPPVAAAPSATNVNTAKVVRVPEDVLSHPADLMTLMQQVRSQIVYKTKKIPEAEYEQLVRPSIVDQLRAAGFGENDVDQILDGVAYSRRIRGIR